jgi:hypothetical protein
VCALLLFSRKIIFLWFPYFFRIRIRIYGSALRSVADRFRCGGWIKMRMNRVVYNTNFGVASGWIFRFVSFKLEWMACTAVRMYLCASFVVYSGGEWILFSLKIDCFSLIHTVGCVCTWYIMASRFLPFSPNPSSPFIIYLLTVCTVRPFTFSSFFPFLLATHSKVCCFFVVWHRKIETIIARK